MNSQANELILHCHGQAQTPQDAARERKASNCETLPPLPAPAVPPDDRSDDEKDGEGPHEGMPAPPVSSSKFITQYSKHVTLKMHGLLRKFLHSAYSTDRTEHGALWACQFFESHVSKLTFEFDTLARKPAERKALLDSAGVDSKFHKAKIADQRDALMRRLFNGNMATIEQDVVNALLKRFAAGSPGHAFNAAGMSVTFCHGAGYRASFQGGKQMIEETFTTFGKALCWLKSMQAADKDQWFRKKENKSKYRTVHWHIIFQYCPSSV